MTDVTAEELEQMVDRAIEGDGSTEERDAEIEAYGTGMQRETESTINRESSPEARRHRERRRARASDDPEEHATGMQHASGDGDTELTGQARENFRRAQEEPDEPLDAYGTGMQGDTSIEEHRKREEKAELLAEALELVEERDADGAAGEE